MCVLSLAVHGSQSADQEMRYKFSIETVQPHHEASYFTNEMRRNSSITFVFMFLILMRKLDTEQFCEFFV